MNVHTERPPDRIVIAATDRRETVLDAIRWARSRVTLSLFRCSDRFVFAELAAAVDRGVQVEVIVTSRAKGGRKKLHQLWRRLERTGAAVHAYSDPVVKYHAKYLVVDDGPALITSMNFTRKCFTETCDALVVTYDPAVVHGLRALMAADRQGIPAPPLPPRLIVGPEQARQRFTALVEQARSSIRLIDAKLSDPDLLKRLHARRSQGLLVELHDEPQVAGMRSHGKIMLIDGRRAVVGSLALNALSLDFRREVAVTVDDPAAVAEVKVLFRSIGEAARAVGSARAAATGGPSC